MCAYLARAVNSIMLHNEMLGQRSLARVAYVLVDPVDGPIIRVGPDHVKHGMLPWIRVLTLEGVARSVRVVIVESTPPIRLLSTSKRLAAVLNRCCKRSRLLPMNGRKG